MEVTIGGNRVGSGKKMKTDLNNYERSTHNLSDSWISTAASGVLYPCYIKPVMRGDDFDIDIDADCRTIPTKGPLFGTYKMQIDFYFCPVRLYQGLLHNNPRAIGLKMNQVKLPKLEITEAAIMENDVQTKERGKFNNSSLIKYLGLSGIGQSSDEDSNKIIKRQFDAVPAIAYYDIFKNYYANQQEEKAYVISGDIIETGAIVVDSGSYIEGIAGNTIPVTGNNFGKNYEKVPRETGTGFGSFCDSDLTTISIEYYDQNGNTATISQINKMQVAIYNEDNIRITQGTWEEIFPMIQNKTAASEIDTGIVSIIRITDDYTDPTTKLKIMGQYIGGIAVNNVMFFANKNTLQLQDFDLSNIDDMRYELLSFHTLGSSYIIKTGGTFNKYPYRTLVDQCTNGYTKNKLPMNGLVLKTYQNDIFNNWLNSDWIEGTGSIADLTKVSVENGNFSLDTFNFRTKLYNLLNRVVVAGDTYEDWQDVVWEESKRNHIETPVFLGGMSKEVVFDEVIQTAPSDGSEDNALGSLGGRGSMMNGSQKGGSINVKIDEAGFIIGIVSLTPRIVYTQGNEFYMTEFDSVDDFHKPAFDGIGYQDLIGERLAWWDTKIDPDDNIIAHRSKIGKLPAWIEYMTSINRAYGEFADETNGYMILNRRYEYDEETGGIKDATTYVDPSKYNYAFAYNALDAQNFWLYLTFKTIARRKMSARIIPNV